MSCVKHLYRMLRALAASYRVHATDSRESLSRRRGAKGVVSGMLFLGLKYSNILLLACFHLAQLGIHSQGIFWCTLLCSVAALEQQPLHLTCDRRGAIVRNN